MTTETLQGQSHPSARQTLHPSHKTRISMDASSYDEICTKCGATDNLMDWGRLALPCSAKDEECNPTSTS